jgi:hypothetical protein
MLVSVPRILPAMRAMQIPKLSLMVAFLVVVSCGDDGSSSPGGKGTAGRAGGNRAGAGAQPVGGSKAGSSVAGRSTAMGGASGAAVVTAAKVPSVEEVIAIDGRTTCWSEASPVNSRLRLT